MATGGQDRRFHGTEQTGRQTTQLTPEDGGGGTFGMLAAVKTRRMVVVASLRTVYTCVRYVLFTLQLFKSLNLLLMYYIYVCVFCPHDKMLLLLVASIIGRDSAVKCLKPGYWD